MIVWLPYTVEGGTIWGCDICEIQVRTALSYILFGFYTSFSDNKFSILEETSLFFLFSFGCDISYLYHLNVPAYFHKHACSLTSLVVTQMVRLNG